jgi:hypothetical protein
MTQQDDLRRQGQQRYFIVTVNRAGSTALASETTLGVGQRRVNVTKELRAGASANKNRKHCLPQPPKE